MTQHAKSYVVRAYGGVHIAITYEEGKGYADWFRETDKDHTMLSMALVSDDAYELVGFGEDAEGCAIGCDSEYLTLEDGRRLVANGLVSPMVTADSYEELDDPETFARLCKEQFGV